MRLKHSMGQHLMAYLLLMSLFLQSCSDFHSQFINGNKSKDQQSKNDGNHTLIKQDSLEGQLIAQGGHRVTLYQSGNEPRAIVDENLPDGFSRQLDFPVYVSDEIDLADIEKLDVKSQQRIVEVSFPKVGRPGYVYVGERGLMGGGKKKKNNKKNNKKKNNNKNKQNKDIKESKEEIDETEEENVTTINEIDKKTKEYIQEFTNQWLENTRTAYNTEAYKNLVKLSENNIDAERVLLSYPSNIDTPVKEWSRCIVLINSYTKKEIEPYLSDQENEYKLYLLYQRKNLIFSEYEKECIPIIESYNTGKHSLASENYIEAEKYLLKAQDYPYALYDLGWLYDEGHVGKKENGQPDYDKAARYYKEAATMNAFCNLGRLYMNGLIGEAPDYNMAAHYYELSGNPVALYNIGVFYDEGRVGKKENGQPDYDKAAEYYKKAATTDAFYNLGFLYKKQDNYQEAIKYLELADDDKRALYHLGKIYTEYFVKYRSNHNEAEEHFKKSAEYFKKSGTNESYYKLGNLHLMGANDGISNYDEAKEYLKKSSASCPGAFFRLGLLYVRGLVDKKDDSKPDYILARNYFEQAVNAEHIHESEKVAALYHLGVIYKEGYLGNKDFNKALNYFEKTGTPESLWNIGNLYSNGDIGSNKDYKKALDYYEKALGKLGNGTTGLISEFNKAEMLTHTLLYSCVTKQEESIIDNNVKRIEKFLEKSSLADSEKYYIQGIKEYYTSNWEQAINPLKEALRLGSKKEGLQGLIHKISIKLSEEEEEQLKLEQQQLELELEEATKQLGKEKTEHSLKLKLKKDQLKQVRSITVVESSQLEFSPTKPNQAELEFLSNEAKKEFEEFKKENIKVNRLLMDMELGNGWELLGEGKPEVLKNKVKINGKEYSGCFSRRINQKDRLVYIKNGAKTLILSWEGHYDDK